MKYLLTHLLLFVSFFCLGQELAPTIVSTAGGTFSDDDIQLSWTLGGSVLDSYSNTDIILSSGVQSEDIAPYVLGLTAYALDIQLFPNPVSDKLTLQFEEVAYFRVLISDLTGRLLYAGSNEYANQQVIDVDYLNIGAYVVQVFDGEERPIKKFKLSKIR
ncbi:MAG: T9SS type A sorting domain-containing protein [Reichenbachiella sp.]|uniref:T9SS type A sorting domain-containing protein n=1 Tax=Reichenbachiella sp. TaxID=2184521 RepID=UPI0032655C55